LYAGDVPLLRSAVAYSTVAPGWTCFAGTASTVMGRKRLPVGPPMDAPAAAIAHCVPPSVCSPLAAEALVVRALSAMATFVPGAMPLVISVN